MIGMKTRIAVALLAVYLIWGSTYLAIRFAVQTIPPFMMAGTRFLIPGVLLVVWRRLAGDPAPTRLQWISASVTGLLLLLGGNGLVSWAEQRVVSGITSLLVGTAPIWMVLIDSLFVSKVRPGWQAIAGLLTGFVGIALLVDPVSLIEGRGHYDMLGIGTLLLAAFIWALGSVYSRGADLPKSSLLGNGMEMLAGSAGLYAVSLLRGEWRGFDPGLVTHQSALAVLYLSFFGSMLGFGAYTWLLRNAPVALASTYAYVNPLIAVLLGNWLGREPLDARIALGAAVIIASIILINLRSRAPAPKVEAIPAEPGD
jgi:drug/metabolite transporter (DMT)-like permease